MQNLNNLTEKNLKLFSKIVQAFLKDLNEFFPVKEEFVYFNHSRYNNNKIL